MVDAIKEMFSTSEQKFQVKCTNYIRNSDPKTYKAILELQLYDNDVRVKNECVGHVEKRTGTRLRNAKSSVAKKS